VSDELRERFAAQFKPGEMAEFFADMREHSQTAARVEEMGDTALAAVLRAIGDQLTIGHPIATLLDSAAGRLERAGGPAYRECSWCTGEARHARADGQWACDEHEGTR
jgi:hypothetical protein